MKDDYSAVHRNIRTARRDPTGSFRQEYKEPWWLPFLGGALMGFALAVMLFLGV